MDDLKWDAQGLIAAIAQDRLTGEVRMLAWMNREALRATLDSGQATFFSQALGSNSFDAAPDKAATSPVIDSRL